MVGLRARLFLISLLLVFSGTCALFLGTPSAAARERAAENPKEKQKKATPEEAFELLRKRYEDSSNKPAHERILLIEEFRNAPCKKTVDYLSGLYKSENNPGIHMAITETLGKIGSADAVKVVILAGLPILASDAYNRQSVGKALEEPLSPEAETWVLRRGLVPELRRHTDLWVRVLQAVSRFKSPQRIPVLTSVLGRAKEPEVQVAILESLEDIEDSKLESAATRLVHSRHVEVQVAALGFLFNHGGERSKSRFVAGLRSPHWQVRLLSIQILSRLKDRNIVTLAARLLDDPNSRVQVTVVRILLNHGGPKVMGPLIAHLDKAKGRVKDDIADALARLTGEDFGPVGGQWESWWLTNKSRLSKKEFKKLTAEQFSQLKEETDKDQRTLLYHGLRLLSNNVAFVIDTSQSMENEYVPREERKDEESRGKTVVRRKPGEKKKQRQAKIEVAKKELHKVLRGLQDGKNLNIVGFDSLIADFIRDTLKKDPKHLVALTPGVREQAGLFVDKAVAQGQTYMLRALETAFDYEEVDTIFLLSDGAPTPASGTTQKILQKLRKWNRLRAIKINTIGFDLSEPEKAFLRQMADEHFGVFIER